MSPWTSLKTLKFIEIRRRFKVTHPTQSWFVRGERFGV